jgi:[protein-PII] uridylyltransferase
LVTSLTLKEKRAALLVPSSDASGLAMIQGLTDVTLTHITELAEPIADGRAPGWALLATGGTGRRELCPGSDIDLLLIHPRKTPDAELKRVGETIWYPLWDAGLRVAPGVHTVESAIELGEHELLSAVSWLDAALLAGDQETFVRFTTAAAASRTKHAKRQVRELIDMSRERHEKVGDVAFLLGPDLRDGHGGLRDVLVLRYLVASGLPNIEALLERNPATLAAERDALLIARAELHRNTKRSHDVLALQEQDAVAESCGLFTPDGRPDADQLLNRVSAASRTIAWCVDESFRRVEAYLDKKRASRFGRALKIAPDIALQDGEVTLAEGVDPADDASLLVRVAAAAALNDLPVAKTTLSVLAERAPTLPDPWPARARNALVALLGAGRPAISVIEALDHHRLMERILPEWTSVRAKPQRNAYHRFTVDRHLVEAACNASTLVRQVARPDLLLVGTWLHDIGKGYPGDHTEVGVELIDSIARRMGFVGTEVDTLRAAVQFHLLLPETATRRDLSDPAVITNVAKGVGDVDTLQLLRALTEADSLATGPTAWSHWKAQLCDDLVSRVERVLAGHRPPEAAAPTGPAVEAALSAVRSGQRLVLQPVVDEQAPELTVLTVAALDRTGLFSALTGSLAVCGAEVLGADVSTTDDGIALDVLRITRRLGGETDWRRVERLTLGALDGSFDLRSEIDKRAKTYGSLFGTTATGPVAAVLVDDDIEERATVVEVRAPDMLALLHRVATTLTGLGLDIRAAKVTTLGHEVVDSFSVVRVLPDGTRAKHADVGPTNEAVRAALLAELRQSPELRP